MNELLLQLSDAELSHIGRLRQEIAASVRRQEEQKLQIVDLEEQNRNLRNGNDELLCELRVAEADFRIQQNLINDLYNMTEERLFRTGPLALRPRQAPLAHTTTPDPAPVQEPKLQESQKLSSHGQWPSAKPQQPSFPPAKAATSTPARSSAAAYEPPRRSSSAMSTTQPVRAASTPYKQPPAAVPPPEPVKVQKRPLSEIEQRARANALRRQMLKKPVCWLFKSGTCTYGDKCNESHDTIPFSYCREYNDTGLCTVSQCNQKHILFDYERMVRDASKTPKPRPIDPDSAVEAAKVREMNLEEVERIEKLRKEKDVGQKRYFKQASAPPSEDVPAPAAAPVDNLPWRGDRRREEPHEDSGRGSGDRGNGRSDRFDTHRADSGRAHNEQQARREDREWNGHANSLGKLLNFSAGRDRGGVEGEDGYVRGGGNRRDVERILQPPAGSGASGASGRNRVV